MKIKTGDHVALGTVVGAVLLTGVLYPRLPERIPTHFDIHGVAVSLGLIFGGFWVVLGLVIPRIRRNPWMGVRTPWTLSSDENWARTHRMAGYAFVAAGVLAVLAVFVGCAIAAPILIVASASVPALYSFVLARQLPSTS